MKLPISLVVITRNSEGRIRNVIEKHKDLVDEVLVVDQYSTDGTYETALELADRVVRRRCKGTADPDRDWAFSLARNPYILYLDDDEELSEEAMKLLPSLVKTNGDIFWFKFDNRCDGVSLKDVLGDDPHPRLFKQGAMRHSDKIHTYPEPAQRTKVFYLDATVLHLRTYDKLVKSNRMRDKGAAKESIELQERFIKAVDEVMAKAKEAECSLP